jgi:exopolyphosphatase/guanosine-5'-triphosphate,3'-diphosphate pyrophosphatase
MTIAVIDIGTNTVLLLVARLSDTGSITPLAYEQRVPRLGKGVDASRMLADDSIERTVQVVREYRTLAQVFAPDTILACGTSAVRDASNRAQLAGRMLQETGLTLEVLTGDDEAYWSYRGALSGFDHVARATVLDIGGGSTEFSTGDRAGITGHCSLDVGSVRLTERLLLHDPPREREIREARAFVRASLGVTAAFDFGGSQLVAVAGTATALAILAQGLERFSLEAVRGYRMSNTQVHDLALRLGAMPVAEIGALSEVMEGRADIIAAGALILDEVMEKHGFPDLLVSDRGVRFGLALREWERAHRGRERA